MGSMILTETDLELMAGLEAGPDYVAFYSPPFLHRRTCGRWRRSGYWDLLTIAEYDAGLPARDGWSTEGPPDPHPALLAAWVKSLTGFPVVLEPDETSVKVPGLFSRWHRVPLYGVRRNT